MNLEELKVALTQLGLLTDEAPSLPGNLDGNGYTLSDVVLDDDVDFNNWRKYCSVTTLSNSTAIASNYNPFASTSFSAFVENTNWCHNLTAQGITYTSTNGRFTIGTAGDYEIALTIFLRTASSTTQEDNVLTITKNGSIVWTANLNVHSSVDPNSENVILFLTLAAGDYIEAYFDSTASITCAAWAGTTMSIKRIG